MLPASFRLNEPSVSLPAGAVSRTVACRPVTGSTFGAQSVIDVDLPGGMWLEGSSLSFRYKVAYTVGAGGGGIIGTPLYTAFQRLQITQAGAVLDSIGSYCQVANLLTNLSIDVGQKAGRMNEFGYLADTYDGRVVPANSTATFWVSGPLPCVLNCSKNLPLFAADTIRLTFTLASLSDMSFGTTANAQFTNVVVSNFEVVCTCYDLGREVERAVVAQGPLYLKSKSFNASSLPVPVGAVGSQSFFFNQRYSSIRSAFVLPCSVTASKSCESTDLTSGNGDYSFQVNGGQYPSLPLSTVVNNSGILTECLKAAKTIHPEATLAINLAEYSSTINTPSASVSDPGKFIPSLSFLRCAASDDALLSGVSSRDTGVTVVINSSTATTAAANLGLVLCYDAMLVIDPTTRKMSVRS